VYELEKEKLLALQDSNPVMENQPFNAEHIIFLQNFSFPNNRHQSKI